MEQTSAKQARPKEVLRKLREARKEKVRALTLLVKEQQRAIRAIKEQLRDSAATVPEIAEATGIPAAEVLWYVATLKTYGEIIEGPKDGDYFRYQLLVEPVPAANASAETD